MVSSRVFKLEPYGLVVAPSINKTSDSDSERLRHRFRVRIYTHLGTRTVDLYIGYDSFFSPAAIKLHSTGLASYTIPTKLPGDGSRGI